MYEKYIANFNPLTNLLSLKDWLCVWSVQEIIFRLEANFSDGIRQLNTKFVVFLYSLFFFRSFSKDINYINKWRER